MDAILQLFSALGQLNEGRSSGVTRQYATMAVCGILAGIAGIAAVGLLLSAIWYVVVPQVGAAGAAFVVAGIVTILCFILAAAAVFAVRRDRQAPLRNADDATAALTAMAHLFMENKSAMLLWRSSPVRLLLDRFLIH